MFVGLPRAAVGNPLKGGTDKHADAQSPVAHLTTHKLREGTLRHLLHPHAQDTNRPSTAMHATNKPTLKHGPAAATIRKGEIRYGSYHAYSLELGVICGAVLLGVVAEDSGTVEGAVVLGEVQPALETVRALASHTQPNNVG